MPPLAFLRLGSIPQGKLHKTLSERSFHRQIKLVSEFTLLVCLGSAYHLFLCAHKLPITYSVVSWCEHHLLMCIWILRLEFQGRSLAEPFCFMENLADKLKCRVRSKSMLDNHHILSSETPSVYPIFRPILGWMHRNHDSCPPTWSKVTDFLPSPMSFSIAARVSQIKQPRSSEDAAARSKGSRKSTASDIWP